ncbi:MAG: transposase family protein [Isosphaeraceae bacterium]
MILQYRLLVTRPTVFASMTGMSRVQFDQLVEDVRSRIEASRQERRLRPGRRRAPGAGHPYELSIVDQLLLTVVWLRHYPTCDVLGYLFGVGKATVSRHVAELLPMLEAAGRDTMRLPDPGRYRRRSLDQLIERVPDLTVIVDSFEQRVQRPKSRAEADRWFSGKKRMHTVKTQIAVDEETKRVVDVCGDAVGPVSDVTLLAASGLARRLHPDVTLIGDGGYVGMAEFRTGGKAVIPRRNHARRPLSDDDRAFNRALSQRRIKVEHRIGQLRTYQSLNQQDRHRHRDHERRVIAVVGLVNRRLGSTMSEAVA